MFSLFLLLIAVLIFAIGAVLALLFRRSERISICFSGVVGVIGSIAGLVAAVPVMLTGKALTLAVAGPFPFARFTVRMDSLAAFMVLIISALMLMASVYSFSYVREYDGRGAWSMGFFTNLFVASMLALMVIDNAFYFLVFFEVMSLSSYFLVIFDQEKESIDAGFLYFLIAHAGSILIMGSFFIFWWETGSLDFDAVRAAHLSAPLASVAFVLAFLGFGAKAGIVPLHSWLPRAHPAAPSHASALMSGVMVKVGVFGIIKVGVDLLHATTVWWGLLVLAIGAISAVLGVLYALAEQDIKRLLAYSTVENVGIILIGVGAGMIGMATGQPLLAVVGMLGALYHTLNHAMFKGLLFLGAGSIIYRAHTRNMEELGGLTKSMPYTGLAFLTGAMAICALPPLNGFVSEWYTYQALFAMGTQGQPLIHFAGPLAIVMLALTGALALACFVKLYGMCFSGTSRSEHAAHATEAPAPMLLAVVLLALACVALGVGAHWIAPTIASVAASLYGNVAVQVTQGSLIIPGSASQSVLSMPLLTVLLVALPFVPALMGILMKGTRLPHRHQGDPWACGYIHDSRMAISPTGFSQPLRFMMAPLFRLREILNPSRQLNKCLHSSVKAATRSEAVVDTCIISPLVQAAHRLGNGIQRLQHGDFRMYCLYVVVALLVLLLVTV
ncbi:MAG: hydrogenase 4 subunit B [Burkholderiaceae bacterium]|nr:hydrogenase 4 subunit B [Burkholderiaceae bacterium]